MMKEKEEAVEEEKRKEKEEEKRRGRENIRGYRLCSPPYRTADF